MDRRLGVIIRKELKRVFTDRRLVLTVLLLPGLSIAIIYSIMGVAIGRVEEDRSLHQFEVETYFAPPAVIEYIQDQPDQRVVLKPVDDHDQLESSKERLRQEAVDLVMVFDADFEEAIDQYKTQEVPNIDTFYNPISDYSQDARRYLVNKVLMDYRVEVVGQRLGDPGYTEVFSIDLDNDAISVASDEKVTGKMVSGFLPVLISIFLFAGAMGIGMDMVAGEKERGTMATILLTPVKRETVALGKIISLGIVAIVSTLSAMAGILLSSPFSARIISAGVNLSEVSFTLEQAVLLLAALILLVGIYVGLIVLASVFSKTVKEAGSYVAPLYMFVLISGVLAILGGGGKTLSRFMIPVYGNILVIQGIISGEIQLHYFAANASVSLVLIAVLVLATRRMFHNEKVMFN